MNRFIRQVFIFALFLLAISACQTERDQPSLSASGSVAGLLQHTVYFYLDENVSKEEAEEFEEGLNELMQIPEIYKYELGIPAATEDRDVTDHSFSYAIFSWFETMEDYIAYAEHPIHMEFIERYNHLWANVRVYDSEIFQPR